MNTRPDLMMTPPPLANRLPSPFLLAGFLLTISFTSAAAQWGDDPFGPRVEGPSILTLLPSFDRVIEGETQAEGTLGVADYVTAAGQPVQAWDYRSVGGETMTFDLVSEAFDAFLFLVGEGEGEEGWPVQDDDSGGGCHARITHTFPVEGGVYRIVVSTVGWGEIGDFTLHARSDPPPPMDDSCSRFPDDFGEWDEVDIDLPEGFSAQGRRISMPGEVVGTLSLSASPLRLRNSAIEGWELNLEAGQTVVIDLESEDFDTYLYLVGPGLEAEAAFQDDDGGEDLNSRIRFTAEVAGSFLIVVSSFGEEEGEYRLRVTTVPTAPAPG